MDKAECDTVVDAKGEAGCVWADDICAEIGAGNEDDEPLPQDCAIFGSSECLSFRLLRWSMFGSRMCARLSARFRCDVVLV